MEHPFLLTVEHPLDVAISTIFVMFLAAYRDTWKAFNAGNIFLSLLQFIEPNMTTPRRDIIRSLEDL